MPAHFIGSEYLVFFLIERIIPTTEMMEYVSPESFLKAVKSVHGMRWLRVGRYSEEIIFQTTHGLGYLDGIPLEGVGWHEVSVF